MKKIKNKELQKSFYYILLIPIFFGAGFFLLAKSLFTIPDITLLKNIRSTESIEIVDRNGNFLFDLSQNTKRVEIDFENISQNIINATLAAEDSGFYNHNGIDYKAILRAIFIDVKTLSFSQGGSTITQQVLKNVLLTGDKKIIRKIKEFILAPKLEEVLSKNEILEIYFNTISYGGLLYGVETASQNFFNKSPKDVSIAEAAYLASLPKAPTFYSPYGSNKTKLEERKDYILERMLNLNLITTEEYKTAINEKVFFHPQQKISIKAPHFVFYVKEELEKKYGSNLKQLEGRQIKTTLDLELQEQIEENMVKLSETLESNYGAKNIAIVVLSAKNGDILTMLGSKDYFDNEIDGYVNVTTSLRQPGSTVKPFVYAAAVEKGLTPETVVFDVPTQFSVRCDKDELQTIKSKQCYAPVNYDGVYKGPIALKYALARSINIPSVKVLYIAGISNVLNIFRGAGIDVVENALDYGLTLVLGGMDIKPLELANAYSIFANDGIFIEKRWSLDSDIERQNFLKGKRVISKEAAQTINDVISNEFNRSPYYQRHPDLYYEGYPVAIKTGTTNNSRDIWITGYSPEHIVLIWAGNSQGDVLKNNPTGIRLSPLLGTTMRLLINKYYVPRGTFAKNYYNDNYNPHLQGKYTDEDNVPHSILHFINKNDIEEGKSILKNDPQYEYWEYGIENYLKTNSLPEYVSSKKEIINQEPEETQQQNREQKTKLPTHSIFTRIFTKKPEENQRDYNPHSAPSLID